MEGYCTNLPTSVRYSFMDKEYHNTFHLFQLGMWESNSPFVPPPLHQKYGIPYLTFSHFAVSNNLHLDIIWAYDMNWVVALNMA